MRKRAAMLVACVALGACAAPLDEDAASSTSAEEALSGDTGFANARSKMEEIRGDLASNQAHLRGVLTPAQTAQYSAAFFRLDRVVKASDDYAKKAIALASNLAKETAKLAANTAKPVPDCGGAHIGGIDARIGRSRDLYNSAKLLATANVVGKGKTSPRSQAEAPAYAVRAFYKYMLQHPDVRGCIVSLDDLEKDLGANHAQMMVQLKSEDPTADALALVTRTFEPLGDASGAVTKAAAVLEQFARTQDAGAFAKAAATPSTKLAGAVLAILDVGGLANDLAHGRYKDFLIAALKGSASDVASISEAVSLLEGVVDSGRALGFVTKAAAFAKVTGRIAAGVGVVTGAIQLFSDLDAYEGDRLLHLSRIAADAAALQASIVLLVGGGELVAPATAIVLLTMTVFVIAQWWHNHEVWSRRNAETKALLRMVGFDPGVSDTLADADDDTLRALTNKRGDHDLGLAPEEVQNLASLAQTVKNGREAFFLSPDDLGWVASATKVATLWTMSSASAFEMIKVTAGTTDATDILGVLDGCVRVGPRGAPGAFASKQGFYDAVASCRSDAPNDNKAAFDRLTTFLRAH